MPEAYEVVLREAQQLLHWTPGSTRSLVMIGDAPPHPPTYRRNKKRIDWRQEIIGLRDMVG